MNRFDSHDGTMVIIINQINLRGKISLLTMKRSYFGKIPIWELNRLKRFALLAQLAEQRAFNPWVLGSNPRGRTICLYGRRVHAPDS